MYKVKKNRLPSTTSYIGNGFYKQTKPIWNNASAFGVLAFGLVRNKDIRKEAPKARNGTLVYQGNYRYYTLYPRKKHSRSMIKMLPFGYSSGKETRKMNHTGTPNQGKEIYLGHKGWYKTVRKKTSAPTCHAGS